MNENFARFYMIEILLGLQEIHKNEIIYRDFKPENILIGIDGHIKIADFGLAKPGILKAKERAFSFCGSPEYMPPQMIEKYSFNFYTGEDIHNQLTFTVLAPYSTNL